MGNIQRSVLEDAWMELTFIGNRRFQENFIRDVRWQDVKEQLQRLEKALQDDDELALKNATFVLSRQLMNQPTVVRNIIAPEPEDKRRPLPAPVREYLNHVIDHLKMKLSPEVCPPRDTASMLLGDSRLASGDKT